MSSESFRGFDLSQTVEQEFEFLRGLGFTSSVVDAAEVRFESALMALQVNREPWTNEIECTLFNRSEPFEPQSFISDYAIFYRDEWAGSLTINTRPNMPDDVRIVLRLFARRLQNCHSALLTGEEVAYGKVKANWTELNRVYNARLKLYGPILWKEDILSHLD